MTPNKTIFAIVIGISLLLGFTLGSALIGAVVKPVHKLTGVLLCRGTVDISETSYNYGPRGTYSDLEITCLANDGTRREITFQSFLVLGVISTLFFLALLVYFLRGLILTASGLPAPDPKLKDAGRSTKDKPSGLERLSELKKMRDENLISQVEYERKKGEIMDEL